MKLSKFKMKLSTSAAAVLVAVAGGVSSSAHADVVYDALSGAVAHPTYTAPPASAFDKMQHAYQCFAACADPQNASIISEPILSLGDRIALTANTGRALTGIDVGIAQLVGSPASTFSLTLSIYNPTTLALLAQQVSSPVTLAAVPASLANPPFYARTQASIVPFAFGPFNLPDEFIYTLAYTASTAAPTGLGIWLWDYYQDGTPGSIPVGTDVGNTGTVAGSDFVTKVYGTTTTNALPTTALGTNNFAGLSNGYTPAVRFNVATPVAVVPEPSSMLLLLAGIGAMGLTMRKRKTA